MRGGGCGPRKRPMNKCNLLILILLPYFYSVSLIEPGPVQTEFRTNITTNNIGVFGATEIADVDEMTNKLQKVSFDNATKHFSKIVSGTTNSLNCYIMCAIVLDNLCDDYTACFIF